MTPSSSSLARARKWLNANEADLTSAAWSGIPESLAYLLDTIAAEARAQERERCAKMFEHWPWPDEELDQFEKEGRGGPGDFFAAAIRSQKDSSNG